MSYPKWIQRAPHVGPVLCASEDEEKQLQADWKAELEANAKEAAAAKAKADAEAKEQAELTLKASKGGK